MNAAFLNVIPVVRSPQPRAKHSKNVAFLNVIPVVHSGPRGVERGKDVAFLNVIPVVRSGKKGGCKGFSFRQASDRLPIGFRQAASTSGAGNPHQERATPAFPGLTYIVFRIAVRQDG